MTARVRAAPEDTPSDLAELARRLGTETSFLAQCLEAGALELDDISAMARATTSPGRARLLRLQRLCRGLEMEPFAASIILDLLERLDELERRHERFM